MQKFRKFPSFSRQIQNRNTKQNKEREKKEGALGFSLSLCVPASSIFAPTSKLKTHFPIQLQCISICQEEEGEVGTGRSCCCCCCCFRLRARAMNYQGLPPLKRFTLLQQRRDQENADPSLSSLPLPAKKRKESRHLTPISSDPAARPTTYCLPTKKRVWALDPDLKPLLPLDLNAEYKPCLLEVGSEAEKKRDSQTEKINEEDGGKVQPFVLDPIAQEAVSIGNQENQVETNVGEVEEEREEERDGNGNEEEEDGIVCAICQSTDGDPEDPIVFCDGCDLMAHATCYGNPLAKGVPEGDWFCNQCLVSNSSRNGVESFPCCLCPKSGGALKSTVEGSWAHVVCALLVPEVFFEDPEGRDSINCSKVPRKRWEKKCYVCQDTNGCAIDCSEPKCPLAFHVTCGLSQDLCIEYREGKKNAAIVAGFCKNHTELWKKQERTGKFKIVAREEQR